MARFAQPTPDQEAGWKEWVSERPGCVRTIAERFDLWTLYRMKSTGDRCTLYSFNENGTVKVNITGEYNMTLFDRQVFGVDPDDLEECDLPEPDEPLGTVLSNDEVEENIDALRCAIRPDLFEMGADGRATLREAGEDKSRR